MQQATVAAADAIEGIGATIGDISGISSNIASAVEQQGAASAEISRNVQQAAGGTMTVSENIEGVAGTAKDTGGAAHRVLDASVRLAAQADSLRRKVDCFLGKVKAA